MYLKLTALRITCQRSPLLHILSHFVVVAQVPVFQLHMMPVQLQPALRHHHNMLHLQIQHQLVVTEQ
jgi:hypothetical protein